MQNVHISRLLLIVSVGVLANAALTRAEGEDLTEYPAYEIDEYEEPLDELEKRAWNSGFAGGMGKRAWNSGFAGGMGKRAWNSGFAGGMGKRAWNSGFAGGMGKRAWNSGFAGGMGKRTPENFQESGNGQADRI